MDPWRPYEPSAAAPWNLARVRLLHWRAGFGASWDVLQRDVARGHEAALRDVLAGGLPRAVDFERRQRLFSDSAASSQRGEQLQAWWVYRLLCGGHPLRERMALVWHDWFATSLQKVNSVAFMRQQNELFRRHGLGRFGDLLAAVVRDPALLIYLDAPQNRRDHVNENLGRELLELFTLGVGHYTEADVKEASRALTGWTVGEGGRFEFRRSDHDAGSKTVLGQTGAFDGDDLVSMALAHPATARSLAVRLCEEFLGEGVPEAAVAALASQLRGNGLDLGAAVATILGSELFFQSHGAARRFQSPVDFVVAAVRCLECDRRLPSTIELADWIARVGQRLFFPPNVGGWQRGRGWFTQQGMLARANFAAALNDGTIAGASPLDLEALAASHGVDDVTAFACRLILGRDSVPWLAARLGGARDLAPLLLASPDNQLS